MQRLWTHMQVNCGLKIQWDYRRDSTKWPWWNVPAGIYIEHIHTAKPQMTLHKLIFYSSAYMQPRVLLDRALCHYYCLLTRLSNSAECVRRRGAMGVVTSSLCICSVCCWEGSCYSSTGSSPLLAWLL